MALLAVSLVAVKAAFRLVVSLLAAGGLVFWVISRADPGSPDQLEARRQAEETRRIADATQEKAESIRREAMIAKQ